jgi:predicted transposase/invertase (TIGR01784 family)
MVMTRDFLPPKSDLVFKWLFGDERNIDLLTALLKSVLDLPESEYAAVSIVDPHLLREFEGDKLGILDVKVKTKSGKVIDIEIQVAAAPELKERIVFYSSGMITEQIGSGDDYDKIKRVISIIITDFDLVDESEPYHHCFTFYDSQHNVQFTDLVEIHTLELSKLPDKSDKTELYNWLRFLQAERKEEIDMLTKDNPQITRAVGVLMELSADEKARLLFESREKARRDEASRTKGAVKSAVKDTAKGFAKKLLKRNRSIEEIIEDTGLSREEIEELR